MIHLKAPNNSVSNLLDISSDGKILLIGSLKDEAMGAEIHLLDLKTEKLTLIHSEKPEGIRQTFIHSLHFSHDDKKVYYLLNAETRVLNIETKAVETLASYKESEGGPNPFVAKPMFDSKKERCLYFDKGAVKVCNREHEEIFKLEFNNTGVSTQLRTAVISPSGKYLAIYHVSRYIIYNHENAKDDKTNRIDIWDIKKNTIIKTIEVGELKLMKIGFNLSDTEIIFTQGNSEGPGFFDIETGKLLRHFENKLRTDRWYTCFDFAYSPNGKYLAVGDCLFDPNEDQKELIRFDKNNRRSHRLLFSNDSKLYIQGGDSGDIFVREI